MPTRLSDGEVARLCLEEDTADLTPAVRATSLGRLQAEAHRRHMAVAYPRPYDLVRHVDPHVLNPEHLALIDEKLAACYRGEIRRLLISMPPQEGKTERVARAGALWALNQNPNLRVVVASYELELARGSTQWVRDMIEAHGSAAPAGGGTDLLGLRVQRDHRAASRWRLDGHRGGMFAVGTKGGLTGRPAEWIIIDDPIKGVQEADAIGNREAVWSWWTGTARTRLAPGAVVIIIGTRWHEDDLQGRLLAQDAALPVEQRQWHVLNLPAIAEVPDAEKGIEPDALGREPGEALPSARGRDVAEYRQTEIDVGPRVWNALYQGHPSPPEGAVFKWAWIRGFRLAPSAIPALSKVAVAVDPAGGGKRDESGIIAGGRDAAGRVLVTHDFSGTFGAGEQWRRAWLAVLDTDADVLVYEKNLVDPIMRKGIRAAWKNLRREAVALERVRKSLATTDATAEDDVAAIVAATCDALLASPDVVLSDDDALLDDDADDTSQDEARALLEARLHETWLYRERILDAPAAGPAAVVGVAATRGKRTRADPAAQAYGAGRMLHAGTFPKLESQMTSWMEGQDSPDRMDAAVWLFFHLSAGQAVQIEAQPSAPTTVPTGRDAAIARPASPGLSLPTGASAVTRR